MPSLHKANQLPGVRELVDAFDNLANAVHRRLSLYSAEVYQFASSIMYHSTIIGSVWRLTEGATESKAICRMPLTFVNRIRYFLCAQDIQRISSKSENFMDEDEINTMGERLSKRADDSDGSGSGFVPGGGNGGTSDPTNGGGNGGTSGPSNGGSGNTNSPPTASPPTASPSTISPSTTSLPSASPTPRTISKGIIEVAPVIFNIKGRPAAGGCKIEVGIGVSLEECLEWVCDN